MEQNNISVNLETAIDSTATSAFNEQSNTFDINKFTQEYQTNGKLSDASYDEISKHKGMTRDEIDTFIYGYKAKAEAEAKRIETEVYSVIEGGQQRFEEMVKWAQKNYSEEEAALFDKAITSGDLGSIKQQVKLLDALYSKANGTQRGNRVVPSSMLMRGSANSGARFADFAEMRTAMKDPRYNNDPKYTAELTAKVARGFANGT